VGQNLVARIIRSRAISHRGCLFCVGIAVALLSPGSIANAAVDSFEVQEYQRDLGVPAEQARRVLETQSAASGITDLLQETLGKNYAGVWFDNEKVEFVVPLLPAASRSTVSAALSHGGLAGRFRLASAESNWAQLEAAQRQVDSRLSAEIEAGVVETFIDPRNNSVAVRTAGEATEAEHARIAAAAANTAAKVQVRPQVAEAFGLEQTACNGASQICDAPFRAGVGIWGSPAAIELWPLGDCTAGFKAKGNVYGTPYVLTAGHCVQYEGGTYDWSTGNSSKADIKIGHVEQYAVPPINDYAKIKATEGPWNFSSFPTLTAIWGGDLEHRITSEARSYVGEYVCHSGSHSGTSCGTVTAVNMTSRQPVPGVYHEWIDVPHRTEFYPMCAKPGDSGGPVFSGNTALGIMTDTNGGVEGEPEPTYCQEKGYYTEVTEAGDLLGVTVAPRTTRTTISARPLNGNPGWVTITGEVHGAEGAPVDARQVQVIFFKWNASTSRWDQKETLGTTVHNGHYEIANWNGVGTGSWLAKAEFPTQGPYLGSSSDETWEGRFEVKDGYRIVNRNSNKCVDIYFNSRENGAAVHQWECLNPATYQSQVFVLQPQGGGYYTLFNRNSGRCLDVIDANPANGAQLQQWSCNGNAQQAWRTQPVETVNGDEYMYLVAKHSGRCLDVTNGNLENGVRLQQWDCIGTPQMKWKLQSVESAPIPSELTATTAALNGEIGYVGVHGYLKAGAYGLGGQHVKITYEKQVNGNWEYRTKAEPEVNSEGYFSYNYMGVGVGTWRLHVDWAGGSNFAGSGSGMRNFTIRPGYHVVARQSKKCLTVNQNLAANGTAIIQWDCSATPNPQDGQVFTLVPFEGGRYFELLINSHSTEQLGRCVDVAGAGTTDGVNYQEWDCSNGAYPNQLFSKVQVEGEWNAYIAKHSGKCMDVEQESLLNGYRIHQWTCTWHGNQQWKLEAVG
jgi:hypothetical protein